MEEILNSRRFFSENIPEHTRTQSGSNDPSVILTCIETHFITDVLWKVSLSRVDRMDEDGHVSVFFFFFLIHEITVMGGGTLFI